MFNRRFSQMKSTSPVVPTRVPSFSLEGLESRRLLSAAPTLSATHAAKTHASTTQTAPKSSKSTKASDDANPVILFSAAPAAVQTGLQTQAGSTTISANTKVHTHSRPDRTEIYCIKLTISGTPTTLAVDGTGATVNVAPPESTTPPPSTSTTNPVLSFSATPGAVQTGLQTQAGSTTISANAKVHTHTRADGTEVYCILLNIDGTPTTLAADSTGATVTVPPPPQKTPTQQQPPSDGDGDGGSDGDGDSGSTGTTGNTGGTGSSGDDDDDTTVAFNAAPAAVQTGLQAQDTDGTISGTQLVHLPKTPDGTVIYATNITVDGKTQIIAVNADGDKVPPPPAPAKAPPAPPAKGEDNDGGDDDGDNS